MRFSTLTVLSFVASTSAFVPVANRPNVVIPFATRQSKTPLFSLSDLESKMFNPDQSKDDEIEAAETEPESIPAPKEEPPAPDVKPVALPTAPVADTTPPKTFKLVDTKPDPKPEPAKVKPEPNLAKPAPVAPTETAELPKPIELNLEPGGYACYPNIPVTPKPGDGKYICYPNMPESPIPFDTAPSAINFELPPIEIPATPAADSQVALGEASLIVGPLVVLAAGREVLSKGAARREEMQKEEKAKKELAALQARKMTRRVEGDEGGIAKAVVSAP
jgi:hypothetical protein